MAAHFRARVDTSFTQLSGYDAPSEVGFALFEIEAVGIISILLAAIAQFDVAAQS